MTGVVGLLDRVVAVQKEHAAGRRVRAETEAPDFTPFEFVERDETGLSRLIRWLLNPEGTHGQGPRFLELFVETFDLGWSAALCASARAEVEVRTIFLKDDRRLDVLVTSADHAIAIENKLWAADQAKQVSDYLDHLRKRFAGGSHRLIYLTIDGHPPGTQSIGAREREQAISEGELRLLSYPDLLPWAAACRAACGAPQAASFIAFFERHIRRRFMGMPGTTDIDRVVDEMATSRDTVRAALEVAGAISMMKEQLLERLIADIAERIADRGWTATRRRSLTGRVQHSAIHIRYGEDPDLPFEIEFDNDAMSSATFGIRTLNLEEPRLTAVHKALTASMGRGRLDPRWWPWCRTLSSSDAALPIPRDWSASEEPWLRMADGTLADAIVRTAEQIHSALTASGQVWKQPIPAAPVPAAANPAS